MASLKEELQTIISDHLEKSEWNNYEEKLQMYAELARIIELKVNASANKEWLILDKRDIELDISKNEREPLQTEYTMFRGKTLDELLNSGIVLTPRVNILRKAVKKYEAEMTNPFCMEWFKEAKEFLEKL